jgi:hypothetical protein
MNRLNYFNPYQSKSGHHEDQLTRAYLPESEPLWKAGRSFVVRNLPWTVEKLGVISRSAAI